MNKRILTLTAAVAFTVLCSAPLFPRSSREDGPAGWRYVNVYERNPWLVGDNVAGLRTDSLSISEAALSAGYTQGDNRLLSQAPRQWSVGAQAFSIKHLKRFSMVGSFGFTQTTMYDACGGMLLESGRFPVGIYEYTPGTKSRQVYSFDGGVSVDIAEGWRVGAAVDFKSTNCSKRKDLRYTDYALDLSFRPGIQWCRGKWSAGLSAAVICNTETVTAEQIGVSETSYLAFIDKGMFYGLEQPWDGGGTHLSEPGIGGFPIRETGWGLGAQAAWNEALYLDLSYLHAGGRIGEKDAIWMNFPSDVLSSILQWNTRSSSGTEHIFRLKTSYRSEKLDENVIEKVTQGGVTTRKNYGGNTVGGSGRFSVSPCWTAVRPSVFELEVRASYLREDAFSSYQYPYVNSRILRVGELSAQGRISTACGLVPILGLRSTLGFLDEDSRAVREIVSKTEPVRQQEFYDNWKWYMTSPEFAGLVGLRYDFPGSLYLEACCKAAFRAGKNRLEAGLSFGYVF